MAISNPVTVATAATGDANPKVLNYNGVVGRTYVLCLGRYLAADSYTSVTDNGGNTWTRVTTAPASGTVGRRIDMWICTPTAPFTAVSAQQNNSGYGTAALVEVQGSSGVINAYASASHASSATPSPVLATPTKSNTLAIAIVQANTLTTSQITPSSGWTAITSEVEGPKIVFQKNLPSGTPAGVQWTFSAANGSATAIVYLEEAGSTASPWSMWNGTTEVPITLDGMWNGTSITPVTFDKIHTNDTPPPAPSMLVGMDSLPGNIAGDVALFPGIKYHRDFGSGSPTSPNMYGIGQRWAAIDTANGAVMHISWKGDPYLLSTFLSSIPDNPPSGFKGVYVSWYHEPVDEVRDGVITAAQFRAGGAVLTSIKNSHPKGHWIIGCGPILTRYDLDELNTDPADYGWAGMDFYGIDCYQSSTSGGYFSNQKMFGLVIDKVHAVYPDIPILIPEYGMVKQTADTSGAARAAAITNHIAYLRSRGDVRAIAYFNEIGSIPGVPLDDTPSANAWRAALASQ